MENINEGQKINLKTMTESKQKKWTEAQEECDFPDRIQPKITNYK